jgi:hypothetical protein
MLSLSLCLVMTSGVFGLQLPKAHKLPIDLPQGASVSFEAEGTGKEFVKTVKQFMKMNDVDPSAPPMDKIPVKTPLGNYDIKIDDLAPLLNNVHFMHIVSYEALPNDDPFKHQEKLFAAEGLKRIAFVPGDKGVLIMRHNGATDQYGIVVKQKENIVILRTDGAPGLGDFGKVLFEGISHAIQQAANEKHGG